MDGLGGDALHVPGLVRLLSQGGADQIADPQRFPECWAFEDPLPAVVAALVPARQGAFYDVGANTGFYSILVGKVAPKCHIRAFEPVPSIAKICRDNLAVNFVPADLVEIALSDRDGTAEIYFPPDGHGLIETSASLSATFNHAGNAKTAVIRTRTLDAVNEQSGETVGFIKIDVEGYEHMVLRGARRVVERDRPLVVIEVLPEADLAELNDFVRVRDYRVLSLRPGMAVAEEGSVGFIPDSWNQLLVPREELEPVLEALQSQRSQIEDVRSRPPVSSWADCQSFEDLLLLQLEVERVVARRESESLRAEIALQPPEQAAPPPFRRTRSLNARIRNRLKRGADGL